MKKSTNIAIGALVAVVVAIAVVATTTPTTDSPSLGSSSVGSETINPNASGTTGGTTGSTTTTTGTTKTYTMAEVGTHNSQTSCWSAINGSVYDLTRWIAAHPGGREAILYLCGIDGTAAFNQQHGGQARPERELAKLKIGTLQK